MTRLNGVIETLDRELSTEPRVTPQFELSLDTESALSAIETMDLYEMKGQSLNSKDSMTILLLLFISHKSKK
jgi:hypothetical protein